MVVDRHNTAGPREEYRTIVGAEAESQVAVGKSGAPRTRTATGRVRTDWKARDDGKPPSERGHWKWGEDSHSAGRGGECESTA